MSFASLGIRVLCVARRLISARFAGIWSARRSTTWQTRSDGV